MTSKTNKEKPVPNTKPANNPAANAKAKQK
jgi:hypothetical protein